MTFSFQQLGAWLTRAAYIAGAVLAVTDVPGMPTALRTGMITAAGVVFAIDRYVTDPSTGNPAPSTTTPPAQATPPPPPA